jgi:hypothetical protein
MKGTNMSDKNPQPRWWILYAVLPLASGLLVLEVDTPMSPVLHQVAEVGIVLFAFGFVELWMISNTLALVGLGCEPHRRPVRRQKDRPCVVAGPARPPVFCALPEDIQAKRNRSSRRQAEAHRTS